MKKRILSTLLIAVVALAALLVGSVARASQNGDSISIAFAREDPPPNTDNSLAPTAVVGVPAVASANWNNVIGNIGLPGDNSNLVRDSSGIAVPTSTAVCWSCDNDWSTDQRSEHNNNFQGDDYTLMLGYLDAGNNAVQGFTIIMVTGLPADFATYDVYIYTLGGVPNRPADYSVNGSDPKRVVPSGNAGQFKGPDYVEAIGDDPGNGPTDYGNYVVFTGQSGDLTITAYPANFRSVINAIEIVKNP